MRSFLPTAPPCKILGGRGFARFGDLDQQKIPLFSRVDYWALQAFPNFFLAEMRGIKGLRLKKFGFAIFPI